MDKGKRLTALGAGLLLAVGATGAQAGSDNHAEPGWKGFYLGAGVGDFRYRQKGSAGGINYNFDQSDTAYKAFLGYRFTPYLGVEGAYADLGNPGKRLSNALGGNRLKFRTQAWYAYLVGYLPIANAFDLFGKAGVADWKVDAKVQGNGFQSQFDKAPNGTDFAWGLGAEANLPLNVSVRAEYERIEMNKGPFKKLDNDLISLSLLLHF
ncbi:MAG TPA: outer membrane beta-barrel protein [Gammaproteobacteria bacterium]|nr:outer membrane beta-barrel protein [Gammaproteobacteria bacterium]